MDADLTADEPYEPPPPLAGAPAAIGEVLAGRWSVAEIRRGGQAWVLIVDDLERGQRRAIKTPLSTALTGDAELAMLLGLEPHPHTVTTLDVLELRGQLGIVFEYAPSTLTDLIRRQHGVHLAEILQQVCDGMSHLSKRGTEVAHLDLKPSNVLVDDTGRAKVADFGLAQQVRIQGGRFSAARGGTWAYAAPEVLRQEPCDLRADVFSFGVLLYEACTGKLPYPFPLAADPNTQRAQLLDYYASSGPRRRTEQLHSWGQSTMTEVPLPPPGKDISICLSNCLQEYRERRPESFWNLAVMLARSFRRPPVDATTVPLPAMDQQQRDLALAQVLIRLGQFTEAVNRLNRLLATPLPPELVASVRDMAQQALTGAGRHAEAAALMDWR
ncbi:serine/threonine-protein kinase [Streptomyces olivochromogenes]|uniref:Serine/threonine protein kinase n=1 Tax=Streptomyces olivochromogenes TaxID=1963 RepID=A0A250VRN8_STROL|nr:serine/threonine-protein kinase [Streptomyces olivochromogenes]GAX56759.1 serine/threonine protein kinase [Streptomyces olivochromogenes]